MAWSAVFCFWPSDSLERGAQAGIDNLVQFVQVLRRSVASSSYPGEVFTETRCQGQAENFLADRAIGIFAAS